MLTTEAVGWVEVLVSTLASHVGCALCGVLGCKLSLFRNLASGLVKRRLRNIYIYIL